MDKIFLCSVFVIVFSFLSKSQTYTFSERGNGIYQDLTDSVSVNKGRTWDNLNQYPIPIGFNFKFYDTIVSQLFIDRHLFSGGGVISFDSARKSDIPYIFILGADLIDRGADTNLPLGLLGSLSPVSYKLSGTVGSRIFKLEFKNAGFFYDIAANNTTIDYVNFQLWLYEGTNDIEFHYGPYQVLQPILAYYLESGPYAGLWEGYNNFHDSLTGERIQLIGSPIFPFGISTEYNFPLDSMKFMIGTIPNGKVFKFSRNNSTTLKKIRSEKVIKLYPNPVTERLSIEYFNFELKQIQVMSLDGKVIFESNKKINSLDVKNYQSGIYLVKSVDKQGVISISRFIKK